MIPQRRGRLVMASPDFYEVCYAINPWMDPERWASDDEGRRRLAGTQWHLLAERFRELAIDIEIVPGALGLPDLVFPANAGVVLDGRALLGRFRHPERRGEEAWFRRFFDGLLGRGLLTEVAQLPEGIVQEGAGDCLWDAARQIFWAGWGPRSTASSPKLIGDFFDQPVAALQLVSDRYYHLDTCLCPLAGGDVVYFPPALSRESQALVAEIVPAESRIVAGEEDAAAFCLNAVAIGSSLVMTAPSPRLRAILEERGYSCLPVDLSAFIMAGGAALCMTLRLDWTSAAVAEEGYALAG